MKSDRIMNSIKYAIAIGAVLVAGALALPQLNVMAQNNGVNGTGTEFSETLVEPATGGSSNFTAGGNYTIGDDGFGNGTTVSGLGMAVDTTILRMHIDDAKAANQTGDTQAALSHVILALEELETILSGNSTSTASMGNMTSVGNMTSPWNHNNSTKLMQ